MLHEILLSLSGLPSPIWDCGSGDLKNQDGGVQTYTTVPERAMLATLSELSDLHIRLRETTETISASHPSMICRAVSSAIRSRQLAAFQEKIVDVESSILKNDAEFVGAYNIVPLSTLVTEFAPWLRRLRWLWIFVKFMCGEQEDMERSSTEILTLLDGERQTGYTDIESTATELLVVGQKTWMRGLTSWILYGRLPPTGTDDFMVQSSASQHSPYVLDDKLIPKFVTREAAESILSIGKALHQLHSRTSTPNFHLSANSIANNLLPISLNSLKGLSFPLRSSMLEDAMFTINQSISQNALSLLLPLHMILELLTVIKDYCFLGNGDFAVALIGNAEDRVRTKGSMQDSDRPVRKLGKFDNLILKDTELPLIMAKTWSELFVLRPDHEGEDSIFTNAKLWLCLKSHPEDESLVSTLLPVPSTLEFALPTDSPLHMFLPPFDRILCSNINAYLLSIRRAEIKMSGLWKLTTHRRCHPMPLGPPFSNSKVGQQSLAARRRREDARATSTRRFWACASKALFVLAELNAYFQTEVIQKNWDYFKRWLDNQIVSRPSSAKSPSRPTTSDTEPTFQPFMGSRKENLMPNSYANGSSRDPRMLALAHHVYLENIFNCLLLGQQSFLNILKDLLLVLDHFSALFERLQKIWQGLDLQDDEGVMDAFSNYRQDGMDVLSEMRRTAETIDELLLKLVGNIKEVEKDRNLSDMTGGVARIGLTGHGSGFTPFKARTLDRLIMKLDSLAGEDEAQENLIDV